MIIIILQLSTGDKFEVQKSDHSCYLQLRVMCESGTRLSVRIGNHFSRPIYVKSSSTMTHSIQCIAVPCSEDGKLPDDTMIIGNEVTIEPADFHMSEISIFPTEVECEAEDSEENAVTVNCGRKEKQDRRNSSVIVDTKTCMYCKYIYTYI